jgi:hypothetical protein
MFRSLSDHHQGDTIFVLTSVTKVTDVAACLQVTKGNEFSMNLINWCLCIFYQIWSSVCLFSLPVAMCVLGPVFSCYCYAFPGMSHTRNGITNNRARQDPTHTLQQACCYINNFSN